MNTWAFLLSQVKTSSSIAPLTAVRGHVLECDHRVCSEEFSILGHAKNSFLLELKEFILILRDIYIYIYIRVWSFRWLLSRIEQPSAKSSLWSFAFFSIITYASNVDKKIWYWKLLTKTTRTKKLKCLGKPHDFRLTDYLRF